MVFNILSPTCFVRIVDKKLKGVLLLNSYRLSREELKKLIISICADWVSIEEIVERSGKSTSYIRNAVIPLLIAEKAIVMMYPGTPRNPNQKYRVKE